MISLKLCNLFYILYKTAWGVFYGIPYILGIHVDNILPWKEHIKIKRQKQTLNLRCSEELNTLHTLAYCADVWGNGMGTMNKNKYITEKSCSCHIYRRQYTYI